MVSEAKVTSMKGSSTQLLEADSVLVHFVLRLKPNRYVLVRMRQPELAGVLGDKLAGLRWVPYKLIALTSWHVRHVM